ncbi:MAG TPA: hypothetical protein PK055_09300 [Gammaproteobacteria bacterium]|nr:hypothetical protein [Xanthomonadales bacterium]MCB1594452.1 hypothetical protein [Xanthomonadales bacterium]HOP22192.1 hypothetical protein [Gammaproteobacteria bacterium]HPI96499.1 hypothetical protein [Gammaproteobacteria bacterium]HPQ87841.1 hypothetical protein [Gammaproteobacteria bacterium]
MKRLLALLFLYGLTAQSQEFDVEVTVRADQPNELVALIENAMNGTGSNNIKIIPGENGEKQMFITDDYVDSGHVFPDITKPLKISANEADDIQIILNSDNAITNKSHLKFYAFLVYADAILHLHHLTFKGFYSESGGGVIRAKGAALLYLISVTFINNFAAVEGGAIHLFENAILYAFHSRFLQNRSNGLGGAISIRGAAFAVVFLSTLANNIASPFGCDFNVSSNPVADAYALMLINSVVISSCANVLFENPLGKMFLMMNTFYGSGNLIDSTAKVYLFANIIKLITGSNVNSTEKAVCNDFGTNSIESLGFNISTESSCSLDQASDMANTDPLINSPDENYQIIPMNNSPVIDAGAFEIFTDELGKQTLPCSYKDSRGLGRPQDANGDGVFECDIGSVEVQGGANLTSAQTGMFYDMDRSGEGVMVEMLRNGTALVTMFTYAPNGNEQMWLIGVGKIVGNSIVVDELLKTTGGFFGPGFNPDNVTHESVGSLSLVFSECNSKTNPGRMTFQPNSQFENELDSMLVKSRRITNVVECDSLEQSNPMGGRSGLFHDPTRSGEGVFVQMINNNRALIIAYTYTIDGKHLWFISSDTLIEGNKITAEMIYPESLTSFGNQFNSAELDFKPWGTIKLEYQPECDSLTYSYNSVVEEYGSATYNYQRVTKTEGTTCDL